MHHYQYLYIIVSPKPYRIKKYVLVGVKKIIEYLKMIKHRAINNQIGIHQIRKWFVASLSGPHSDDKFQPILNQVLNLQNAQRISMFIFKPWPEASIKELFKNKVEKRNCSRPTFTNKSSPSYRAYPFTNTLDSFNSIKNKEIKFRLFIYIIFFF